MRAVIVTDIHWDQFCAEKRYTYADKTVTQLSILNEAIAFANGDGDGVKADIFADLGDRVMQQGFAFPYGRFVDAENVGALRRPFSALDPSIERYFLDGNHDGTLSVEQNQTLFGDDIGTSICDHESLPVRIVFWGANVRNVDPEDGYTASQDDIAGLKDALEQSSKPVMLFSHIPFDGQGDHQFRGVGGNLIDLHHPFYNNANEIRDVVFDAANVVLAGAGHLHRFNRYALEGTEFLHLPSLTRPFSAGAAMVLDFARDAVEVSFRGNYSGLEEWRGRKPENFVLGL